MRFGTLRLRLLPAAFAVALALVSSTPGETQAPAGRLDSGLTRIVESLQAGDTAGATETAAADLGIDAGGGDVRVIVEADDDVSAAVAHAGGTIEGRHEDLVQVRVPPASLEALASAPGVSLVRVPMHAVPLVTGEGVALTNASAWQAAGLTGAGVKVAVLDLGFAGYQPLLGTELPSTVTTMSFRADGDITGGSQPHGTAVAEIVHEMAPGAALYLVNFDTEVELASATAWLNAQGVDIINASWGYFSSGPGDGTGIIDSTISASVAGGAFWSVSTGNYAQRHWSGPFTDTDNDTYHEFQVSPLSEADHITATLAAGTTVIAELKWDDPYGAACRDYDLYLVRFTGNNPVFVGGSENAQHDANGCVPGADPVESMVVSVPVTADYYFVVKKFWADSNANLHLFSIFQNIDQRVAANSLTQPADNPDVTTVAAVPFSSPGTIEAFSSIGPTTDGRIKPDIAGPDGVSSATYGSFFGTSASSPHIAGAAALMLQRQPCLGPAQLRTQLESNVVDLGAAGKDTTFGAGRLSLGTAPADTDSDGLAPPCDNCPSAPNANQADTDADSVGDACDNCPATANANQADTDTDSVGDACDNCPAAANANQLDTDSDSFGDACDPDDNNNGVADSDDIACGADPLDVTPPISRPERTDPPFAGVDDDGDTAIDEVLPAGAEASDCDGDGYAGTTEAHVFSATSLPDQDPCGLTAWPADLISGGISTNKVNIQDLSSFIAPVRRMNTSPTDAGYDVRWDLVPGPGILSEDINIQDLSNIVTVTPPMLAGPRAFNGPPCPWPS